MNKLPEYIVQRIDSNFKCFVAAYDSNWISKYSLISDYCNLEDERNSLIHCNIITNKWHLQYERFFVLLKHIISDQKC